MVPRTWLAALLVASMVLAGCAQEGAPETPEEPTVILVTDENDLGSLSNDSFMMAAHQHDYWGGADRLLVMDASLPEACCMTLGDGGLDLEFVPASVIPHGTARVEFAATWDASAPPSNFGDATLWVKTAADHEPALVGPIASGETVTIETDDADLDLPHQSVSAWRFIVHLAPGTVPFLTNREDGEFVARAEAVRGREIPIYPPHPDLWDGAGAIALLDEDVPPQLWSGKVDEDQRNYSCLSGCWPRLHRAMNGTIVPYDATKVEVLLDARPDPGFDIGLKYHGADTREFTDLSPVRVEGSIRVYEIPVAPGVGDSPYATQSVWGFAIFSEKPERDEWFSGSYAISARALR